MSVTAPAVSSGNAGPSPAGISLLTVGAELLGVSLLALVAGINDQAGKLVVMIMVGFWLIYLVGPGAPEIAKLGADFQAITNNSLGVSCE